MIWPVEQHIGHGAPMLSNSSNPLACSRSWYATWYTRPQNHCHNWFVTFGTKYQIGNTTGSVLYHCVPALGQPTAIFRSIAATYV